MVIKTRYKYFLIYLLTLLPILAIELSIYNSLSDRLYQEKIDTQLEIVQQSNSVLELLQDPGYINEEPGSSNIVIMNSLSNAVFGEHSQLLIMNEQQEVLYTTNNHLAEQNFLSRSFEPDQQDTGYYYVNYLGVERVLVYSFNSITGMYLMVLTPDASIHEGIAYLRTLMTIFILATIALHVLLIFFISSRIANPITKIRNKLAKLERGNVKDVYNQKHKFYMKDELWEIDVSFYKIREHLEKLVKKEYEYELKLKEAKLLALQSQVNPHFLYNTLETINSIATVSKVPEIAELSSSLSNMFRYNIGQKIYVPIREEINHINDYLTVQMTRFEDTIEYSSNIEEGILEFKTLKFSLQPIVENCFAHAFKNINGKGKITIEGFKEENQIIFRISDNGLPMKEKDISNLTDYLSEEENISEIGKERESVGLRNVHKRLQLYFGEEYGITLKRNEERGLVVLLNIPIEKCSTNASVKKLG